MASEMSVSTKLPTKLQKFVKCTVRKDTVDNIEYKVRTYSVVPTSNSNKILKHGPDDYTYQNHPELLKLVPRGFSELWQVTASGEQLVTVIKGVEKFDGTSVIDEDELSDDPSSNETKQLLDHKKIQEWANQKKLSVTWQEKANGKFAIFQLLNKSDNWYIFGGSKNFHVFRRIGKPKQFVHVKGNDLHFEILNAIINDLNKLEPHELELLDMATVVGEYVDGKHLVYCNVPYMVYFACPAGVNLPRVRELMPAQDYLPTIEQLQHIRKLEDIEGVVICYTNTDTKEVCRQKHKTVWYILLRCWRELLSRKNKKTIELNRMIILLYERTSERSEQFLHLSADELTKYIHLATDFCTWLHTSQYDYTDVNPFGKVGMAKIWNAFLNRSDIDLNSANHNNVDLEPHLESQTTHESKLTPEQKLTPENILQAPYLYHDVISLASANHKVCVIMSGLPGSGKSTVALQLSDALQDLDVTTSTHSTDDFFMKDGTYNFVVAHLGRNHVKNLEAFCDSKAQVKIVDNTNTVPAEYNKYVQNAQQNGYVCIVLACQIADISILVNRNTHNVPVDSITKMATRYKSQCPSYYGVFFTREQISEVLETLNLEFKTDVKVTQQTPPHVTCMFVGGNHTNHVTAFEYFGDRCGTAADIIVKGLSISAAGAALVVETSLRVDAKTPHVTLSTNTGFKPVNVGEQITKENTLLTNKLIKLKGIISPTW